MNVQAFLNLTVAAVCAWFFWTACLFAIKGAPSSSQTSATDSWLKLSRIFRLGAVTDGARHLVELASETLHALNLIQSPPHQSLTLIDIPNHIFRA